MIFYDDKHKEVYEMICNKMHRLDCYRQSIAYLIALDSVTREHINDLYDFTENCIKLDGIHKAWQTGTSQKTTRLAFNLWNGLCSDDGEYNSSSRYYAVDEIFSCSEYAQYYYNAIQIRFEY